MTVTRKPLDYLQNTFFGKISRSELVEGFSLFKTIPLTPMQQTLISNISRATQVAFDWEIWIQILKSGFHLREIRPQGGFQLRISWISFLPFDWEIQTRICKTILMNSTLLFMIIRAHARPLFLGTVFQILFWLSQSHGTKEIQEQISQH